ncbi:MAG: hypothetical protein L0Z62_32945 [Gemmataceae bacterium]|nr:hypothetical protein [Gemmataceae bacterium]
MPDLPPLDHLWAVFLTAVLPAGAVAAALASLAVVERLGGPKLALLGATLGLAGGVAVGLLLGERLPLVGGASSWNRLPWAALAVLAVGLFARLPWLSPALAWLLRGVVVVDVAWWVLPSDLSAQLWWMPRAFAAVMLLEWALLEYLARRSPGGGVPLILALSAGAASVVLLYAGSGKLAEVATALASALGGIAVVAWLCRTDGSGAVPGSVVLLPGLLVMGWWTMGEYTEVPWLAFLVPGLAPLTLLITLVPPFRSWEGRRLEVLRLALVLAPLAFAVTLTLQTAGDGSWE